MRVLKFKYIFFRSFVGSSGASQAVFTFLLIPCCLTKDFRAPPFLPDIPFLWAWNAPTEPCSKRFNVPIDLSLFSLIGNPQKDAVGQPVTLFHSDSLGFYPHIDKRGNTVHGGIPQLGLFQVHFALVRTDIMRLMPKDNLGLAIIDWEEWRPIWERNWKPKDIYRNRSIELVQQKNPQLNLTEATNLAKKQFEAAGKKIMQETLKLVKSLRPKHLWGYYLFPDCYNDHYDQPQYNGSCFELEKRRNDELDWLWNESTALFPSIYLNTLLKSSPRAPLFVRNRVQEAIRVSKVPNAQSPLPVFIYACPVFTDVSSQYLTQEDLVSTVGETISLGASGVIMWGSLDLSKSVDTCRRLHDYMQTILNPYLINVTLASKICSQVLCQGKGICTRKIWDSDNYLHLNPLNVAIESSANGTFQIKGKPSHKDLKHFAEHFHCSCYTNNDCEKEVVVTDPHTINVCAAKDVCLNTVLNKEEESLHSSLMLFMSFLIILLIIVIVIIVFFVKTNSRA